MLNLRDIEVFKPYADEVPEAMLVDAGGDDRCVTTWLEAATLRVAKLDAEVLGCYAMDRLSTFEFRLHGVVVAPSKRKQGLGRWLTGHAIGVAESKGGRQVSLPQVGSSRCFQHIGFVRREQDWVFDLIQE